MTTTISEFNRYQQLTSCRLSSTTNLSATYTNGQTNNGVGARLVAAAVGALTLDGIAAAIGNRVLIRSQTSGLENGIYQVIDNGSAAAQWILERTQDFRTAEQIKAGYFVPVEEGSTSAGAIFTVVGPFSGNVGVDTITFSAVSQGSLPPALVSIAGLTTTSNDMIYTTAPNTYAVTTVTSFGRTLLQDSNAAAMLSTLGAQPLASIHAGKHTAAGGGNPIVIADASITTSSVVLAQLDLSANAAVVNKVTTGAGDITVTFDTDPGASVINYIAFLDSQP